MQIQVKLLTRNLRKTMAKYFDIPVNICVQAETREDAETIAYLFMPWTNNSGRTWHLQGHSSLGEHCVDNWVVLGVDTDEMEAKVMARIR
jgi:hypothetical protein